MREQNPLVLIAVKIEGLAIDLRTASALYERNVLLLDVLLLAGAFDAAICIVFILLRLRTLFGFHGSAHGSPFTGMTVVNFIRNGLVGHSILLHRSAS